MFETQHKEVNEIPQNSIINDYAYDYANIIYTN